VLRQYGDQIQPQVSNQQEISSHQVAPSRQEVSDQEETQEHLVAPSQQKAPGQQVAPKQQQTPNQRPPAQEPSTTVVVTKTITPKPRPRVSILNLPPDALLSIASELDYVSWVFLKLSGSTLYAVPPMPPWTPTNQSKMKILDTFSPPSNRVFTGDRTPLHLCKDCMMWHTFEHLQIFPHPRPEKVFRSYSDYAIQKPRICRRHAIKTKKWVPGERLDESHILCKACLTPKNVKSGLCSWNCGQCHTCTSRKEWSARCSRCYTGEGPLLPRHDSLTVVYTSPSISPISRAMTSPISHRVGNVQSGPSSRQCGRCLGLLSDYEGSASLCRCYNVRQGYAGWK
jgi:hypothetical protein